MNEDNKNLNQDVADAKETGHKKENFDVAGEKVPRDSVFNDKKETDPEGSQAEKKYTDKDVDDIINKKYAKWQEQKEKEISEAEKLANMDANQRIEYERDQLKKELDELKAQNNKSSMAGTARKMLSKEGVNIEDELIYNLITDDAETTKNNVDSFIGAFNKAVDTKVNEILKGKTPYRYGGQNKLTKAEILDIKDEDERRKAIAENLELFD
jgi:hypothetical protein